MLKVTKQFLLTLTLLCCLFSQSVYAQDDDLASPIGDQQGVLFEPLELVVDNRPIFQSGLAYWTHDLPPGLSFDVTTNTISGRPTLTGEFSFELMIDDVNDDAPFAIHPLTWTIALPPLELPEASRSVARQWNELLLAAIRKDFARPTVHARNLFHVSSAMYDAWSVYDETADMYLLNKTLSDFACALPEYPDIDLAPNQRRAARETAISHAAYRLLSWRFENSPGHVLSQARFDALFERLGYDKENESIAIETDSSPAILGNYIAQCYIDYGLSDGANEAELYTNQTYRPVNLPLQMDNDGTIPVQEMSDPNRWQPLAFGLFIGQSGIASFNTVTQFVGPEWGQVKPFALSANDLTIHERDGHEWWVYFDPSDPPYLDGVGDEQFKWGFSLVPRWAAYLDPADGVRINISPSAQGNKTTYDPSSEGMLAYYKADGFDVTTGREINPHTGDPYAPNEVLRGDYGRVIAEFWADGPDSETPPGHWFTLLNEVSDAPELEKRYMGEGELLDALEWDVKSYFMLGGAMHDVAVSVWGIKGYYDYVRPVSAVRHMARQNQFPLEDGFAELVTADDPLAGDAGEHVGKTKLYTWLGPDNIEEAATDVAGVGWILAENWWPYQRPTFVSPPFAGYVSGHSAYSRAAAELLTALTGDPFFPSGLGEFVAPKDEFLVFEEGPSEDVVLQWATYQDAADQSALSRIWGGIHPPMDDMPARLIGEEIGKDAFVFAQDYFVPVEPKDVGGGLPSWVWLIGLGLVVVGGWLLVGRGRSDQKNYSA